MWIHQSVGVSAKPLQRIALRNVEGRFIRRMKLFRGTLWNAQIRRGLEVQLLLKDGSVATLI